jgi:ferric-dicitrate binding protein FerR (iron transport regulator)
MIQTDLSVWKLISGELNGELTPEEMAEFETWMQNKENKALYQSVKLIHQGLKALHLLNKQQGHSWQRVERNIRSKSVSLIARRVLKYAAVILISFLSGLFVYSFFNTSPSEQYAEVNVKNGQTCHLSLFDGTEVWLNSGTSFKYPRQFNTDSRNVYLNGEAFFKVARNKDLPFKVNTEQMQVEVLGTSFNVSAYQGEREQSVVLVEGKVQINNVEGNKICNINPGQIALRYQNGKIEVRKTDVDFYTGWKSGKIVFTSETIYDVTKKIERWYNVQVEFEKESLKNFRLSGTILLSKPVDQVLEALAMLAPISFRSSVPDDDEPDALRIITILEE